MEPRMAELYVALEQEQRRRDAARRRMLAEAGRRRRRPSVVAGVGAALVAIGRRLEAAAGPAGGEWGRPETRPVAPRG